MSSRSEPAADHLRALARRQSIQITVRGACMRPLLEDGARVTIRKARSYWPGDVIAFRLGDGTLAVHRVVGYRPSRRRLLVVTKADGSSGLDAPLGGDRILGRVCGGECDPTVHRVPLRRRCRALLDFGGALLARLARR